MVWMCVDGCVAVDVQRVDWLAFQLEQAEATAAEATGERRELDRPSAHARRGSEREREAWLVVRCSLK